MAAAPQGEVTALLLRWGEGDAAARAGLSVEQTAEAVGLSRATVNREWAIARAWLRDRLAA